MSTSLREDSTSILPYESACKIACMLLESCFSASPLYLPCTITQINRHYKPDSSPASFRSQQKYPGRTISDLQDTIILTMLIPWFRRWLLPESFLHRSSRHSFLIVIIFAVSFSLARLFLRVGSVFLTGIYTVNFLEKGLSLIADGLAESSVDAGELSDLRR